MAGWQGGGVAGRQGGGVADSIEPVTLLSAGTWPWDTIATRERERVQR